MIVTFLTDFGLRDAFVGTMKGVIPGICPGATIVDLNHEIDPQNIAGAAVGRRAYSRATSPFPARSGPHIGKHSRNSVYCPGKPSRGKAV